VGGRWLVTELLRRVVPETALVVAVDPGKASNRVWLTSGKRGLIGEPVWSVPSRVADSGPLSLLRHDDR
jgi:hypothetical protein